METDGHGWGLVGGPQEDAVAEGMCAARVITLPGERMQGSGTSAEKAAGYIPHVYVLDFSGQKEYGVFLTDLRAIFVLTKARHDGLGLVLGGPIGALVAGGLAKDRPFPYANYSPALLSLNPRNIIVPHSAIGRLHTRKTLTRWELCIEYVTPAGELKKFWADVKPDQLYVKQQQSQGVRWKDIFLRYARAAQELCKNALPPAIATGAEWAF